MLLFVDIDGEDDWFSARGIVLDGNVTSLKLSYMSLDDLKDAGHCLTDIYVHDSLFPMAGRGVFARRRFTKGEIVSISPVLLFPKEEVIQWSQDSLLINYCIAFPDSDMLLLPLGTAALLNHQMPELANVEIEWSTQDPAFESLMQRNVSELLDFKYAPFDIAYRATRDIEADEELALDYGTNWIHNWATHLALLNTWTASGSSASQRPHFRQPIEWSAGFVPDSWRLDEEARDLRARQALYYGYGL
jgi:hypothetical protein